MYVELTTCTYICEDAVGYKHTFPLTCSNLSPGLAAQIMPCIASASASDGGNRALSAYIPP